MRLIDADALHVDYIFPTTTTGTTCYRYVSMQQINSAPTIDAVQERKGRWIVSDNPGTGWYRVICSECGEDVTSTIPMIGFFPDAKPLWNYCPNCGAHMEGAEE